MKTKSQKKKPRLFYYDHGVDSWCYAPKDLSLNDIIQAESLIADGEEFVLKVKRMDYTDKQLMNLPDIDSM